MIRVAITPVEIFEEEVAFITMILDAGWDYVHLRHPETSIDELRQLIGSIDSKYYNRLKLHDNFELVEEFKLGGVHLNRRNSIAPDDFNGGISKSCHTIGEIEASHNFDYITLSPIFDSISKEGYNATFSNEELMRVKYSDKVVALGGITPLTATKLNEYEFIGYAVLGYLFNSPDITTLGNRLNEFEIIK